MKWLAYAGMFAVGCLSIGLGLALTDKPAQVWLSILLGGATLVLATFEVAWRAVLRRPPAISVEALQALSPVQFERLVKAFFERYGYQVEHRGRTGDGGVDLVLRKDGELFLAQCKRWRGAVGVPTVRDFYGAVAKAEADGGFLVASSRFTESSRRWAEDLPLRLVTGEELVARLRKSGLSIPKPEPSARLRRRAS